MTLLEVDSPILCNNPSPTVPDILNRSLPFRVLRRKKKSEGLETHHERWPVRIVHLSNPTSLHQTGDETVVFRLMSSHWYFDSGSKLLRDKKVFSKILKGFQ